MHNLCTQFAVSQDLRPWASPFAPVASDPYAKKGSWVSRSLNPLPILNAINLYYLLLFKMLKNQTKFNIYFLGKVVFISFIKSKEWENTNNNSIEISDFYMFRVNGVMYHKYVLVGKVYKQWFLQDGKWSGGVGIRANLARRLNLVHCLFQAEKSRTKVCVSENFF